MASRQYSWQVYCERSIRSLRSNYSVLCRDWFQHCLVHTFSSLSASTKFHCLTRFTSLPWEECKTINFYTRHRSRNCQSYEEPTNLYMQQIINRAKKKIWNFELNCQNEEGNLVSLQEIKTSRIKFIKAIGDAWFFLRFEKKYLREWMSGNSSFLHSLNFSYSFDLLCYHFYIFSKCLNFVWSVWNSSLWHC